jgi:hypothetical protein
MKNIALFVVSGLMLFAACKKNSESERFILLTTPVWSSDSLLVNGTDASGTGQLLEKFKGDAKFNKDGTGTFGQYTGTWRFSYSETNIVIESDSLQAPISTNIAELTAVSLKITTVFPSVPDPLNIRMTFKAK